MDLTEIYKKGEAALRARDIGFVLDGVETEFVKDHLEFNDFISDTFKFQLIELIVNPEARFVANLYFFWQFQQELNK